MMPLIRGLGVAGSLVLVSTLFSVPQSQAQTTSAYVYVQSTGPAGPVYGYNASSSGQLSAISGSPFKPGTAIVGGTKTEFFTIGKTLLHSWTVGSNGAIGAQKSQVPFLNYSGSSCGGGTYGTSSAVLDHSGQYIYVVLQNGGTGTCSAYQTYKLNSDGSFTFDGDSQVNIQSGGGTMLPSILGNETFAYADDYYGHSNEVIGFQRQSTGTLQYFGALDPSFSGSVNYTPYHPDASPTENFVVVQEYLDDSNPPQLGSFTVGPNGSLTSTNTPANMPTSQLESPRSTFSPDGRFLVLFSGQVAAGTLGDGIEIYNFNDASPLTLNTRFLNGTPIDQVAWDNSGHLYAISTHENKLWVVTVTPSSVAESAPVSITSPWSIVVVNQTAGSTCAFPSSDGVNVCSPQENATVTSPVQINARAVVSGGVYRFELWSGSTKLATVDNSGIMNQTVSLAPGTYHLTFAARNAAGTHEYATRDITVK